MVGYLIWELPSNFRDFTWAKFSGHNLLSLVLKDQKLFLSLTGRVPLTGGNIPQELTVSASKGRALQLAHGLDFLSIQAYGLWMEYPLREKDETERYVNHRVSPLDPLHDDSPDGRHRPGNGARDPFKPHCAAHYCRPAVRNAGAGRKAIGVRHHPPRVAPFVARPRHPHEGGGSRRSDRQVQRSLLLCLDTPRARRDRALLHHPLGARTVGAFAMADRRAAQTRCQCMTRQFGSNCCNQPIAQ